MNHNLVRSGRAFCKAILFASAVLIVSTLFTKPLFAGNGTWVQDSSGTWSNASNWLSGVADGARSIADFSTINITADRIVTLDSSRSIGQLLFRDNTTASNNWTLTSSGGAVLTMDNGASQPLINVIN